MSFNEGTYYISTNISGHKAIDIEASEPMGRIIEYQTHGGKNQQWRLTRITHEEFSIQSVATSTYITAPSRSFIQHQKSEAEWPQRLLRAKLTDFVSSPTLDGSDMTARGSKLAPECNSVARWKVVKAKGDAYFIHNVAYPNKVLDVSGSNQADLTPILVYTYHGGANQQFTFKEM
ncbi:uncharacterized protein Triagg1_5467 [Trichoderma aggressivum f. europaeum]|uniref:Ricin B lectin domain-containing protein n=1 Tax=Trichoderma aggressivum f. europaeum TaxID=173218 RepID=A0AAE1IGH2_9HYPO|nr:hypothetical protein Triagg1_5467 [Trichoderma aggressivum f. europaeum]